MNIIKQGIHIYVAYSRPNGWTDCAEICCGHSWGKLETFLVPNFFSKYFFHGHKFYSIIKIIKILFMKIIFRTNQDVFWETWDLGKNRVRKMSLIKEIKISYISGNALKMYILYS